MLAIQGAARKRTQREVLHEIYARYRYLEHRAERLISLQEEKVIRAYRILDETLQAHEHALVRAERKLGYDTGSED